jgi:RNA-binding protein
VGKEGVTERAVTAVGEAFNTREILKVKVLDSAPLDARTTGEALASSMDGAHLVQVIGRTVVLYRPKPEDDGRSR